MLGVKTPNSCPLNYLRSNCFHFSSKQTLGSVLTTQEDTDKDKTHTKIQCILIMHAKLSKSKAREPREI